VSPLRGEKPQNWPLSKLNTGRFALRAMLPVTISCSEVNLMNSSAEVYGTLVQLRETAEVICITLSSRRKVRTDRIHCSGFACSIHLRTLINIRLVK